MDEPGREWHLPVLEVRRQKMAPKERETWPLVLTGLALCSMASASAAMATVQTSWLGFCLNVGSAVLCLSLGIFNLKLGMTAEGPRESKGKL